jgi:hypothetical protein
MKKITPLADQQKEYAAALQKMLATPHGFRFQTERADDGSQHVEIVGGQYHLIATERGLELARRKTNDKNELLYWLVADTAFWQAVDFELKNRVEGQDGRRLIFARQLELLEKVNAGWAQIRRKEIDTILAENPFTASGEQK